MGHLHDFEGEMKRTGSKQAFEIWRYTFGVSTPSPFIGGGGCRAFVFRPLPTRLILLSDDLSDESVAESGFPIGPRNRRQGRQKVEWEARVGSPMADQVER
jgi:hypothetical protein